jgi:hypothetical protein
MLLALCGPLGVLAIVCETQVRPMLPIAMHVGAYSLTLEHTMGGPVINGVPDPSVRVSARVSLGETRVDLYGCGPTPSAAVESLTRDVRRQIENLAYQARVQAET